MSAHGEAAEQVVDMATKATVKGVEVVANLITAHGTTTSQGQLNFGKDNANERNVSLLTHSRVQLILCKDNANIPLDKAIA